jgi:ribosomal protein L11 methyltransferase
VIGANVSVRRRSGSLAAPMQRIALTVRADVVEEVLDGLLPLVPQGVHPTGLGEAIELAMYGDDLPSQAELEAVAGEALVGFDRQDAPADRRDRKRLFGRTWEVGGRLIVRPTDAPPAPPGVPELVIEAPAGEFGTGAHPTTRMCLELLLDLGPGGGFVDLGCGAGVLAIAAARLGWDPVRAVDHERRSVVATARNAERNGVDVHTHELDLLAADPPWAATLAANVPPAIHERIAARLTPEVARVIVSGVVGPDLDAVLADYARAGLEPTARRAGAGWRAVLVERARG